MTNTGTQHFKPTGLLGGLSNNTIPTPSSFSASSKAFVPNGLLGDLPTARSTRGEIQEDSNVSASDECQMTQWDSTDPPSFRPNGLPKAGLEVDDLTCMCSVIFNVFKSLYNAFLLM